MLETLSLYNNSYVLGFLKEHFPNVFDVYLHRPEIIQYPSDSVVYVDDEMFRDDYALAQELFTKNQDRVFVVKIKHIHELAKESGAKSVLFPWWHIVDDCIAFNLLSKTLDLIHPTDDGLSFNCFNRRFNKSRLFLIKCLRSKNLLDKGWVTGFQIPDNWETIFNQFEFDKSQLKPSDLEHFVKPENCGFERHSEKFNDVIINISVLNSIHINHRHHQPINIAVESMMERFFPTEKSFLAFCTKKLPIVLAESGSISILREQGFDMFDDIIDHGYDLIPNQYQRIANAIDSNQNILKSTIKVDGSLIKRLDNNWNHLIFEWTYAKLKELQDSISRELG